MSCSVNLLPSASSAWWGCVSCEKLCGVNTTFCVRTCATACGRCFGDGKNGEKERGDQDSRQHEEVQAGRDEAAAGGDASDPAEGGICCSQAT